eukprot:TRINITY_DN2240_c0_g2_i1.p1 TRINITY_DN2240_c0_g2~~TRINITY_DN2240_c0_g2_i1.p1  ORF type:complete len:123 (-),score=3.76 TRINITY_DN2240_c0_g2_i1:84-416(-)
MEDGVKFQQDAAPPGGYGRVRVEPRLLPRWPGRYVLFTVAAVGLYAFKKELDFLHDRRQLTQIKLQERWDLIPYIVAEHDTQWVKEVGREAAERHHHYMNLAHTVPKPFN